jgi:hypothetical protein
VERREAVLLREYLRVFELAVPELERIGREAVSALLSAGVLPPNSDRTAAGGIFRRQRRRRRSGGRLTVPEKLSFTQDGRWGLIIPPSENWGGEFDAPTSGVESLRSHARDIVPRHIQATATAPPCYAFAFRAFNERRQWFATSGGSRCQLVTEQPFETYLAERLKDVADLSAPS